MTKSKAKIKVIPYDLARLKIHLKQIRESIDHAKDFQEKYWDYMTESEKDSLMNVIRENIKELDLVKKALKESYHIREKQNEKSN